MYDDILVPTDGSAGMDRVLAHAADLAGVHDATVHALYVVDTASLSDLPLESSWNGVSRSLREEGRAALEEARRRAGDVPVETELVEGSPVRDIVDYARDRDCDLVVMGTHGRAGVDRLLLGSVAERIVRQSPVPVLTIRVSRTVDESD
jgi:nucleotide-binding universal stress UspA family protein